MHDAPIVICGRGHSGTRLMAQILIDNEYDLGYSKNVQLDSTNWSMLIIPLYNEKNFSKFSEEAKKLERSEKWGWKLGETIFVFEEILRLYPDVKFLNMVRDGRDVIISKVWDQFYTTQKMMHQHDTIVDISYFWQQKLWAESWIKHVELGLILELKYPENFKNISYEKLCIQPKVLEKQISLFVKNNIKITTPPIKNRIKKWKDEKRKEYLNSFKLMDNLLRKLYVTNL